MISNPRAVLCIAAVLLAAQLPAATFQIGPGDTAGLINAWTTAVSNGEADEIVLAPNAVYEFDGATLFSASALPSVASDSGTSLTLTANGATFRPSSAPGTPQFRLINVATGADLRIDGLTIADVHGGTNPAISVSGALQLTNSRILRNTRRAANPIGGAIFFGTSSRGTVQDTHFEGNVVEATEEPGGGALGFSGAGPYVIERCQFIGNRSVQIPSPNTDFGRGGAIYASASATGLVIRDSHFEGNRAEIEAGFTGADLTEGGGISLLNRGALIERCSFVGNFSNHFGSAIYIIATLSQPRTLRMVDCTVIGNLSAPEVPMAAIHATGPGVTLELVNVTAAGNDEADVFILQAISQSYSNSIIGTLMRQSTVPPLTIESTLIGQVIGSQAASFVLPPNNFTYASLGVDGMDELLDLRALSLGGNGTLVVPPSPGRP